jgi:hypothetical protein
LKFHEVEEGGGDCASCSVLFQNPFFLPMISFEGVISCPIASSDAMLPLSDKPCPGRRKCLMIRIPPPGAYQGKCAEKDCTKDRPKVARSVFLPWRFPPYVTICGSGLKAEVGAAFAACSTSHDNSNGDPCVSFQNRLRISTLKPLCNY